MNNRSLVLVADDELRITKLVAATLREEQFRVITAESGTEAIRLADELRPDIALLDILLPDLDGIEVMRQLRESRPIPVILLTGITSATDKARGLDLGADDYIAKPFHPDELAARVRAVRKNDLGQRRRHARQGEDAAPAPRIQPRKGGPALRAAHQGLGAGVSG